MVIMAGAVFFLIRLSLAAIPAIALRYPIKKWAAVGAMLGALAYLLISGAAFATVRSYIMISIMFLAVLLDRPAVALRNVALAALAILLVWPESLFDPGFQMSFAAVVALVSAYEWLRTRHEDARRTPGGFRHGAIGQVLLFLGGIVTSTLVASLAVAPFGIYHFHNTQQFAILANLLAIPICNLLVMPAGTGGAARHAVRSGGDAAVGDGHRHRCHDMVRDDGCGTAGSRRASAGDPHLRLRGDGGRRLVVHAVGHALAAARHHPDCARPDAGADRTPARCAGRSRCRAGCGARRRWRPVGAGGTRLQLRAGALAGARRRQPPARRGRQGARLPLRRRGLRDARQRPDAGRARPTPRPCATTARAAAILVLKIDRPRGCAPQATIIDAGDIGRRGAHALYIDGGRVRIETVAAQRGRRPWSTPDAAAAADALCRG